MNYHLRSLLLLAAITLPQTATGEPPSSPVGNGLSDEDRATITSTIACARGFVYGAYQQRILAGKESDISWKSWLIPNTLTPCLTQKYWEMRLKKPIAQATDAEKNTEKEQIILGLAPIIYELLAQAERFYAPLRESLVNNASNAPAK